MSFSEEKKHSNSKNDFFTGVYFRRTCGWEKLGPCKSYHDLWPKRQGDGPYLGQRLHAALLQLLDCQKECIYILVDGNYRFFLGGGTYNGSALTGRKCLF